MKRGERNFPFHDSVVNDLPAFWNRYSITILVTGQDKDETINLRNWTLTKTY